MLLEVNKNIAVLGLDGLSWRYLHKLIDGGAMSFFRQIYRKGVSVNLYAFPPMTPPSWTSIMTGVNLGKHGIYDFFHIINYEQKLVNSLFLRHPRIHEMLSFINKKSIVINPVPAYPLFRLRNCIQISIDFFTPKPAVQPADYKKVLDFFEASSNSGKSCNKDFNSVIKESLNKLTGYVNAIEYFLSKLDPDLFWINLRIPDPYLHKAPLDILGNKIYPEEDQVFRIIDKVIRILYENFDNLVIVSDHGFHKYRYVIELNTFLYNKGYVVSSKVRQGLRDIWEFHGSNGCVESGVTYISSTNPVIKVFMNKYTKPIGSWLKKLYERLSGKSIRLKFYDIDPRLSKAYLTSSTSFAVKVNDHNILDELAMELSRVKGLRNVYLKNQLFNGPFIDILPDIYIEPDFDNGYYIGTNKISGAIVKPRTILNHHPLGVFWIKNWDFDGSPPNTIMNFDVANIVMTYLDVPLSLSADNLKLIESITHKKVTLTSIYLNRWKLIEKIGYLL